MGKVGTGWSRTVSSQIRKQLDTVVRPKSKPTKSIKKPKATWVEPTFVADVEYWTSRPKGYSGPARSRPKEEVASISCEVHQPSPLAGRFQGGTRDDRYQAR